MTTFDVAVLAAVVFFVLPIILGAATFSLLIALGVPRLLNADQIKPALVFELIGGSPKWYLTKDAANWPSREIEWSVATALAANLAVVAFILGETRIVEVWLIAAAASSFIMFGAPLILYICARKYVLRFIQNEMILRLNTLTREEDVFVRRLNRLGARIEKLYGDVNLSTSIQTAEISKTILFERATGEFRSARPRLERAIQTLRKFSDQVGDHLNLYRQVTREFEFTKNMIIDVGSVTLLGELDRLNIQLDADDVSLSFDAAKWDQLQSKLSQIAFDLSMLRNMAEGGSDLPLSMGQACQLLNISRTTSLKSAKAVVDALRKAWHPDTGFGDEDKDRRTTKTAQINVAWEIFSAAYNLENGGTPVLKRTLELA